MQKMLGFYMDILWDVCLPSGKRLHNYMENHHANGTTHYFDWAIFNSKLLVYQRVNHGKSSVCSTHKLPTDVDHCRPTHGATVHFRPAAASAPTLSSRSQSSGASTSTSSRRPDSAMVAKEGQKSAESVG